MSQIFSQRLLVAPFCLFALALAHGANITNTATVNYIDSASQPQSVQSNTVSTIVSTPASVQFYHYSGGMGSNGSRADGSQCGIGSPTNFQAVPPPTTYQGGVINLGAPVNLDPAAIFHAREPVFVALADANRNEDPLVREFVEVEVLTSNGDREQLRLQENDVNSGVFVGVIQSVAASTSAIQYDCQLSLDVETKITVHYTDPSDPLDTVDDNILVDPFGVVINSTNGTPLNGVTVTLLNDDGTPGTVFDDDGVTQISNVQVTGVNGKYRFPLLPPGDYKLVVSTLPTGYSFPSSVPLSTLNHLRDTAGNPFSFPTGYKGDRFTVAAGPAINIDLPADPQTTDLVLTKTAAKSEVSAGDFIRYELNLRKTGIGSATGVYIIDTLPRGFRYRAGSLRIDGQQPGTAPTVSANGSGLTIPVGNFAVNDSRVISYVVEVTAGAQAGPATNSAVADSPGGSPSNTAQYTVEVKDPFFASRAVIIGRILQADSCDAKPEEIKGVPKVRLLTEGGNYVVTDNEGRYHFENVLPGTHVIRVDEKTLPESLEMVACDKNTRFAGRANSQFVDVQGGTLWRADFYVRKTSMPKGLVKIHYKGEVALSPEDNLAEAHYTVDLEATKGVKHFEMKITLPEDFSYLPMSGRWGDNTAIDAQLEKDKLVFRLPELKSGEHRVLTFRAIPQGDTPLEVGACLKDSELSELIAQFNVPAYSDFATVMTSTPTCNSAKLVLTEGQIPAAQAAKAAEIEVLDDVTASGGNKDWVQGAAPGIEWLFPGEKHNPRSPSLRVVIKKNPGQKIELRVNGEPVSKVQFERTYANGDKSVLVDEWKGVPLIDGDNYLEAMVTDEAGQQVELLKRTVHYSNTPEKIVFLPELSRLVANGVDKPRIAIRLLDKLNHPVRKGVRGTFVLGPPYISAQFEEQAQKRQLSALDRFEPEYVIFSDDGLAYIELAPTNDAGEVKINLPISENNSQEIRTWLEPEAKDWIVVGFAEGTAGYKTIKENSVDASPDSKDKTLETSEQIKLYAKGKISAKWIVTLAYDSRREKLKHQKDGDFKGIVDPNEFYSLYADDTTQRADAASSAKIYVKIERSKFYALFGDYDANLTETELGRYNRSFTGIKSEYSGDHVGYKAFAAQSDTNYAKEEIQGQGTSFLYRLSSKNILINSEKVRAQVRDQYHSEKIISETVLTRYIDYDIDYSAGTINFKTHYDSHDGPAHNDPQFLVVEYETIGNATQKVSYGGRVEGKILDDKIKFGVTQIQENNGVKTSDLQVLDAKIKFADQTEIRVEGAQSNSRPDDQDLRGHAYLVEFDHRNKRWDLNTYIRREQGNFGIGQTALSEIGTFKAGAKATYHLTESWDLNTEFYHIDELSSGSKRDLGKAEVKYKTENGSVAGGFQHVQEKIADSEGVSDQLTASITRRMYKNKFELQLNVEQNIGAKSGESLDYPSRYAIQASYQLTEKTKVFAAEEYATGRVYDAFTTRAGFETLPWKGAKLTNTVNQSISEDGVRNYANMGLAQSVTLGKRWTLDGSLDGSQTLNQKGPAAPINPSHPLAVGGFLGNNSYSEDFVAVTAGATYRAEPWTWNVRAEDRMGEKEKRYGLVTNLIRELSKGVVVAGSASYFVSNFTGGANGKLFQADTSLAYRPLDSRWTILDKLAYRLETADNAQSLNIFGQNSLQGVSDALSSAIVNNFNLNRLSRSRKNQFSIFYGNKVTWDKYDGERYQSYIDLLGLEIRQDISEHWDLGFQGSVLHSWSAHNEVYSFGPSIGWSPTTNGWVSVGYNFQGFYDRDFEAARYTQQGIYLKVRIKFDEKSLGLGKKTESTEL